MNRLTKILLSVPSLLSIAYMLTFISVDFFKWVNNNIADYNYQALIVFVLTFCQISYLTLRLWKYENIEGKTKKDWTTLLIIFNFITSLIFIWRKDDEFAKLNNNTVHNNG